MSNLSDADFAFLLIDIILVLGGLLTWAFWTLDQWREKKLRRLSIIEVIRHK